MNWNEYSKLALRTESIPNNAYGMLLNTDLVPDTQSVKFKIATRLLHAAMGLVTETQEIETYKDKVNLIEEAGDCFWYLPIFEAIYPEIKIQSGFTSFKKLTKIDMDREVAECPPLIGMREAAANLLDKIGKRHIFYGKSLNGREIVELVRDYVISLWHLCRIHNLQLEDIWEANIKKLEKRYPDLRFNGDHAVNRNVANELAHIEQSVDMESKDQAYAEDPIDPADLVKSYWSLLKKGISTDLIYDADPDKVAVAVLEYLNCTENYARYVLGEEFERCRFTIVHDGDKQILTAVPLKFKEADAKAIEARSSYPTYEVALDGQGIMEVTAKGFNSILRNDFTPNEIERIAMGLSFELGNKFKAAGMDILATAMGGVYREYSGRGDKLADNTVFGMYEMMGYPKTIEGILAIANSILRKPKDASDNSSAG